MRRHLHSFLDDVAHYFAAGYLWGRAISSLLNSGLVCGKEIVGIGHSVGSTIMFVLYPIYSSCANRHP